MLSITTLKSIATTTLLALPFLTHVVSGQDFSLGQPKENCFPSNYTKIESTGTFAVGEAFCASKHNQGILINSLEFQADEWAIRGMTVHYTDGSSDQFGDMQFDGVESSRYSKLDFDPIVDTFTKVALWNEAGNKADDASMSRVAIDISNGASMDLMKDNAAQSTGHILNIGNSGMLLGIGGRAKGGLDRLEFIFAKEKIRTRSLEDMVFKPTLDEINLRKSNEDRGFSVEDLDFVIYKNDNNHPDDYLMRGDKKRSKVNSFTKTTADTFHLGLGFEIKLTFGAPPLSGEITRKIDVFWEHTETRSSTTTTSEEVTLSYQRSGTIPALSSIYCNAYSFKGTTVDITWTGMSRVTFMDDTYLEFPSGGLYNTAQFTRTNTICGPWNGTTDDAARLDAKVYKSSDLRKPRTIGARSKAKLPPYPLL